MERPAPGGFRREKRADAADRTIAPAWCEDAKAHLQGYRWRYAKVTKPATTERLTSKCRRIAIAGDWVIGPQSRPPSFPAWRRLRN